MSQIMARVRVRSGLTRYRSLRTLLTSTGASSNRVLDGALQASLYSRSAESNVMLDPMFIEFSAQYLLSLRPPRNGCNVPGSDMLIGGLRSRTPTRLRAEL